MKRFLIIDNMNAITYKEVFPLIKDNKIWYGVTIHSGDRAFNVPDDYPFEATVCGIDNEGKRFIKVKGVRWFTNLPHNSKRTLELTQRYDPDKYPKYDNYDAIEVSRIKDIPYDYEDIMGVPITILDYNLDEFDIVGEANHGKDNEYDLITPSVDGKTIFKRVLIKIKKKN
jgi:hypothetical protein